MPTIHESLDALDNMVTNHASTSEIRSQLAYIVREVAALQAELMSTYSISAKLQEEHAKLKQAQSERDREVAIENRHKVGVTLTTGVAKYYDADTYEILPNESDPKMVEIRKTDTQNHTYRTVATARWSEIVEVHEPAPKTVSLEQQSGAPSPGNQPSL